MAQGVVFVDAVEFVGLLARLEVYAQMVKDKDAEIRFLKEEMETRCAACKSATQKVTDPVAPLRENL